MRKDEIIEYISEQKGMLELSVHVDMTAEHWAENSFGKFKVVFFRPWIFKERKRCFNCIFIYALKTFLPGIEAAQRASQWSVLGGAESAP